MTSCSDDVIRISNAKAEINRDEGNYERRLDETTKMSTKVKQLLYMLNVIISRRIDLFSRYKFHTFLTLTAMMCQTSKNIKTISARRSGRSMQP